MTQENLKRRERNKSEVVEEEFLQPVLGSQIFKNNRKNTLPQKSFVFNAVNFKLGMELPWNNRN